MSYRPKFDTGYLLKWPQLTKEKSKWCPLDVFGISLQSRYQNFSLKFTKMAAGFQNCRNEQMGQRFILPRCLGADNRALAELERICDTYSVYIQWLPTSGTVCQLRASYTLIAARVLPLRITLLVYCAGASPWHAAAPTKQVLRGKTFKNTIQPQNIRSFEYDFFFNAKTHRGCLLNDWTCSW